VHWLRCWLPAALYIPACGSCMPQVGMQNSALAAVLARTHFTEAPMAVVPCVLSACCHATLGSLLAGYWNAKLEQQEQQQQQA
jgi:predicted Na+-dependent transporter